MLCELEDCNKENLLLLKRFEMIMANNGNTERSIEAFIKYEIPLFLKFIKDKPLTEIESLDVENFLFYCRSERKNTATTICRKYTALNSFFKHLIKKRAINIQNPLDMIDKPKERPKLREPLTVDEVNKIFDYIDNAPKLNNRLRAGAVYALFLASGVRLSELLKLKKSSLDMDNMQFIVMGKGMKPRICVFDEFAKDRIKKYLDSRLDNLSPLILSREKNEISGKALQMQVRNVASACGIESRVFPHKLRHTAAHTARENNVPIEDIQVFLGHASPATTAMIYARGDIRKIRNKFSGMYDKNKGD